MLTNVTIYTHLFPIIINNYFTVLNIIDQCTFIQNNTSKYIIIAIPKQTKAQKVGEYTYNHVYVYKNVH